MRLWFEPPGRQAHGQLRRGPWAAWGALPSSAAGQARARPIRLHQVLTPAAHHTQCFQLSTQGLISDMLAYIVYLMRC